MGYVRDTVNGEIRLEGDDFGAASARIQLPAAPAGAKKMQIVWRAWYDDAGVTAASYTGKGWNHTNLFGLGFTDEIYRYPASFVAPFEDWLPDDFFGWITAGPCNDDSSYPISGTPVLTVDRIDHDWAYHSGTPAGHFTANTYKAAVFGRNGSPFKWHVFRNGIGGNLGVVPHYGAITGADNRVHLTVAANAATGAVENRGWEIWASEADLTMYSRLCVGGKSRAGDSMFDVFTDPARADQLTIHGNVTSTFRPSFGACVFPRWLKMRCSHPIFDFVFKEARVRYFDWDENELEA